MESIVNCGYIMLPTQPVAKAMINSILEFCDGVKHRKEDTGLKILLTLLVK